MPIKINVISIFFPPETGAAPSRILNMCQELQKRGADVEVITSLPNYPKGKIYENYRGRFLVKEKVKNITARRYWLYPSNSKNPILRVISMFSFSFILIFSLPYLWRRKPNVIIINSPPLLSGFGGVLISKLTGAKTITNISDIWPLSALELGAIKNGTFYSFLEKVERFIYKRSNACMAQSQETIDHIKSIFPEKSTFLYRNLSQTSPFIDLGVPYEKKNLKIVYAGLLGVAQGVFEICKNIDFKKLGVEFHIYGAGNELEKIKQYISINPGCNIIMNDMIPKDQVAKMLSNYHATLIPLVSSIYGAMPSKVYMAISSGLPMFFSGMGEGAKVVNKFELGWVNAPKDFIGLERNILEFTEMGKVSFENMKNKFKEVAAFDFDFKKQNDSLYSFLIESKIVKNKKIKSIRNVE